MRIFAFFVAVLLALWMGVHFAAATMWPAEIAAAVRASAAICSAAALLAMAPVVIASRYGLDYLIPAAMASMLLRLGLTLGIGWYYLEQFHPSGNAFRWALCGGYLVVLFLEVSATAWMAQGAGSSKRVDLDAGTGSKESVK